MKEPSKKPLRPPAGDATELEPELGSADLAQSAVKDEQEPVAGLGLVPIWLIVLLGVLFYWGQIYLDRHGGGFNAQVYEPYDSFAHLKAIQPSLEDPFVVQGRLVYSQTCAPCHQGNGRGTPPLFPPLDGSEWVLAEGPERIIRIVLNGASGPFQVKGQSFNSVMLPWRDTLDDQKIAAVLTFVRQEWGNQAPPVSTEQVAAIRQETQSRSQPWTEAELLQVPLSSGVAETALPAN